MADDYSVRTGRFTTASGRLRPQREVREAIARLTAYSHRVAEQLIGDFAARRINEAEFVTGMQDLLRNGHIIAASVGRGGRSRMMARDWGEVGRKLSWQYGFVRRFANQIVQDKVSRDGALRRAKLYVAALHTSYWRNVQKEYIRILEETATPLTNLARLVTTAKESCPDCLSDAEMGWMGVEFLSPIGSRECGDFCACYIEFMDDIEAVNDRGDVVIMQGAAMR